MSYPAYLAIRNGHDRCAIVFSSFSARDYGPLAFSYKGHFQKHESSSDLLFVKDVNNQWYNRSLSGMGDSIDEIADHLRQLTRDYRHITTFGSSMGGYASILYGSMLGAAHIVALSPQTLLQEPFPRYSRKIHRGSYVDLSECRHVGNPNIGRYSILVGEEELFDIYQVNQLRQKRHTDFVLVPTAAHNVVKLLDDQGMLSSIVADLCGGTTDSTLEMLLHRFAREATIDKLVREHGFSSMLDMAIETYYRDRTASATHLNGLLGIAPDWLGAMTKLGMCRYAAGDTEGALTLFETISSRSSTVDEFSLTYATHFANEGNATKAIEIAARAVRIEPGNKFIFQSIADTFERLGLDAAAEDCRSRWSRIK